MKLRPDDYHTLRLSQEGGVLLLELHRPDQLNAFTVQMADELEHAFRTASEDDTVAAIVVTGAGKAFCAGMDLSRAGNVFGLDETLDISLAQLHARFDDPAIVAGIRDTGGRVTLAIHECKKPVIGAINGAAVGIGATMTLAMDVRLASSKARIGFVFGRLGIVPEACSTWFLPRLVGLQQALEWVYSAELFGADEALRAGLVRSISEPAALLDDALALARRFSEGKSAVALALTRQMMRRNAALASPREAHAIESLAMLETSKHGGKEGVAAFLEKRAPAFADAASAMPAFYPWWNAEPPR
jgi:enoyl-CoA hydratase/carnithine racemase